MDKPKTNVVKSKSSNSAITTKSEPRKHNKKSRSNAEFQPLLLKKRGVYVEKKLTKVSIDEQGISPVTLPIKLQSPRAKPRVGRKRFLASVLNILSQSTTGTQYPDLNDRDRLKKFDRGKYKARRKREEEIIREDSSTTRNSSKRKKYKSKFLNDNDSELEQLVVLQTTKEITHSPSVSNKSSIYKDAGNVYHYKDTGAYRKYNYKETGNAYKESENTYKVPESIKWADVLPPLVKNLENVTVPDITDKKVHDKIEKKVKLVDTDPSTLVAQMPKRDEKKLYNFFVDLLETTFSVYNVKTEFNQPPPSSLNSSKVLLEMDESVAKKLNIQKDKESYCGDVTCKTSSKNFYCITPEAHEPWNDKKLHQNFQPRFMSSKKSRAPSPTKSLKKKRKLLSESFDYKKAKPVPMTSCLTSPQNRLKKERKKHFINLLKEQLKMEDNAFEEPQNFFQALKVMARNKRRCQKSIHSRESKKPSEGDVHVCQFKRRRVLSTSTYKSNDRNSHYPESEFMTMRPMRSCTQNSTISSKKRTTITITETSDDEPSQHSLEVFGFDYDTNGQKRALPNYSNIFTESYHSTTGNSVQDYNVNDAILKYSESASSTEMVSHRKIRAQHGLRSLSKLIE